MHGKTFDELFRKASVAMKYVKDSNETDLITFKEEMADALDKEINLLSHIKKAIENEEFSAAYQSKVDAQSDCFHCVVLFMPCLSSNKKYCGMTSPLQVSVYQLGHRCVQRC
jgi:predicted signal transduction protein with EAL and GGDEF domain